MLFAYRASSIHQQIQILPFNLITSLNLLYFVYYLNFPFRSMFSSFDSFHFICRLLTIVMYVKHSRGNRTDAHCFSVTLSHFSVCERCFSISFSRFLVESLSSVRFGVLFLIFFLSLSLSTFSTYLRDFPIYSINPGKTEIRKRKY